MDNRITKKRLSDFLSYEWIMIIIVAVAAIIVMELFFTVISVRTTEGQRFNYYYDENVSSKYDETFYETVKRDKAFSYDIKEFSSESLTSDYNVLSVRLSTNDGDAIFTDTYNYGTDGKSSVRTKTIIDSFNMFTLGDETDEESILYNAKQYLSKFLSEGKTDVTDYANLDENKIAHNYNERTEKERVYRNDIRAGIISVSDEYARIEKLCEEVSYFEKIVAYDKTLSDSDSIFYSYKRFEQSVENGDYDNKPSGYDDGTAKKYGLNVSKLGEKAKSNFELKESEKAADVILLAFDFKSVIPDLQYETIAFINSVVRNYADFADSL